jgi:uncharacterized lipoprotein YddW (UPF0748 family)
MRRDRLSRWTTSRWTTSTTSRWTTWTRALAALTVVGATLGVSMPAAATERTATKAGADHERILENLYGHPHWQGRLLWLDLAANRTALDSRDEVRDVMRRTAQVGFHSVVVDVKNSSGYVAYQSRIAPHLSTTRIPDYQPYPADYDLLQTVVEEGHRYGLDVIAAVNVFSEGSTTYRDGPAFDHPDWQTTYLTVVREVTVSNGARRDLDGVDVTRGADMLVIYTPERYDVSPANQWGVEASVVDGQVVEIVDRVYGAPPLAVPDDGFVLSGHGEAATWMRDNLVEGARVSVAADVELVRAQDHPSRETFVNPNLPEVQDYELSILEEIARDYDVDGIALDRARYANLGTDFSPESRAAFETYLGRPVANWPADVMSYELDGFAARRVEGPLFTRWIEWRAHVIQKFFQRARDRVLGVDPSLYFTDYVGAWYPLYYEEGVNWGSRKVKPDYEWASERYGETGYAEDLDFLMVGTYFEDVTRQDAIDSGRPADWYSVEGSAEIATQEVNEATFVYASLYLLQYHDDPDRFRAALEMALQRTHGIMVFDLIYLEQYDWWGIVREVFDQFPRTREPHTHARWHRMLRADG